MARFSALFIIATLLSGILFPCPYVSAKKSSLRLKAPSSDSKKTVAERKTPVRLDADEMACIAPEISFSGFDKPFSSHRESFLITNNSSQYIASMRLRIIYRDLTGRMLHSRDEKIDLVIPPSETRQATIKSFDSQSTLYYRHSKPPKSGGQPFDVAIEILQISVPRNQY